MRHLTLTAILFLFALSLAAEQHPTGVLEPTPERRQWIKENAEEWQPRHQTRRPLPSRVINDAHLPHVFSQGELGICGSFAPTYYVRNYYESKARGEGNMEDMRDIGRGIFELRGQVQEALLEQLGSASGASDPAAFAANVRQIMSNTGGGMGMGGGFGGGNR